ncbi:MAG: 23S rRNA pseudouridine1911/1915/1917 synthase [Flavobacteriales bacterium]|jgi:23S rRNA pseudouridine1911/1915/1917 synthase
MTTLISETQRVPINASGTRLDQVAAELFPGFSRSKLQTWIKDGNLLVDGRKVKANAKLGGGELLILEAETREEGDWGAEDIALDIVYQDDAIIVINKPIDLVVHPAAGNWDGTLLNGLIFHFPELRHVPRAGIVHRLDKDTSGLMVVARTLESQSALVAQLQERTVSRTYRAIVYGLCELDGRIETQIDRHPHLRTKMAVVRSGGKTAITHYRCLESFGYSTYVELKLETGRTHQIRVHMNHAGWSLAGDQTYKDIHITRELRESEEYEVLKAFPRQALHAKKLGLVHPTTSEYVEWETPLPEDMRVLLNDVKNCS